MATPIIALITDFGQDQYRIAKLKTGIKKHSSEAEIIDITHDIPVGDVRATAFTLMTIHDDFPDGTTFVISVGSQPFDDIISVHDKNEKNYVSPNNGILTYSLPSIKFNVAVELPRIAVYNPEYRVFELIKDPEKRAAHGHFGDELFAITAAWFLWRGHIYWMLSRGAKKLGLADITTIPTPEIAIDGDTITGEVIYITRQGNVVTSIGKLQPLDSDTIKLSPSFDPNLPTITVKTTCSIQIGNLNFDHLYIDKPQTDDPTAFIGSHGHLEISSAGNLNAGDKITLTSE